jgi:hypothetical protein
MCIPEKNIRFNVTGYGEAGFCRIRIPTTLMDDPYTVFVNGSETIHHLLTVSNGTYSFLYFTYHHSTQEVIIIYETLSYQLLFLFMIAAMAGVIVYKKSTCAN